MPIIEVNAQAGRDMARGRNGGFIPRTITVFISVRNQTLHIEVDSRKPGGISPIMLELSVGNARNLSVAIKGAVDDLFRISDSRPDTEEKEGE